MPQTSLRTMLVLGGARSGKSAWAEEICEASDKDLVYIATSPQIEGDREMAKRIDLHRQRRSDRWTLIEEELDLARAISSKSDMRHLILVDCLTLWLNNLIYRQEDIATHLSALSHSIKNSNASIIFISNEIGQGVVPIDANTRHFRDEQGRLNQFMAALCDQVIEVKAGIPQRLKPPALAPLPFPQH